jgi:ubiquinone/menaquinone biosynthesis C-methylase UbiE
MTLKKLNFACGSDIREGFDNCDSQKSSKTIFCDADKFPYTFKDNTYDYILMKQCLNLFLYPRKVLMEMHRIAKKDAIIDIEVGYFSNKGSHNDLDTLHYFNEYSFIFLCNNDCRIDDKPMFELMEIRFEKNNSMRFIPLPVAKFLSLFINGMIAKMYIKIKVLK